MSDIERDATITAVGAIRIALQQQKDHADYGKQATDLIVALIERYDTDGYHRLTEALIRLAAGAIDYSAKINGHDTFEVLDQIEMDMFSGGSTNPE